MKTRLACAVCATAVATCATLPSSGAGVNAFSYIQKGLAACYDGVENAGAGVHDANATTWVDLTGNGNDGTVASGITWAADGCVCTGGVDTPVVIGPSLAAVTGSETFTVEFAGKRATTGRGVLFGQYPVNYSVNLEYAGNGSGATDNSLRQHFLRSLDGSETLDQRTTRASLTYANGDSATLALTTAPTERGLWKNGVLGVFSDTSKSERPIVNRVTDCNSCIGGDFRGGNAVTFIGTCNACRLYDRVLTQGELAVNAAVDAVRFRGADPATLTLPIGWSFDAQTNLLATVTVAASGGGTMHIAGGAAGATVSTNVVQDGTSVPLTVTAVPDAGFEFVTWGGDMDAIMSVNGNEATVRCIEPTAIYAVFRPDTPPTASTADYDYVTNGLVVWYDGADNAGVGVHDGATSIWTDISGNGRDATLNANLGWVANGWTNNANCYPVALGTAANTAVANVLNSNTFTVEFMARPTRTNSRENYFASYNTGGFGIEHNSSSKTLGQIRLWFNGNPDYDTDVTQVAGESAVFTVVANASSQKLYKNGQLAFTGTRSIANNKMLATATYYIGNDASRPNNAFKGTFHSFRVYNRQLTAEEVAQNAAADRARLLESGATSWTNATGGAWLDADAWDYGVPNVFTPAALTRAGATKTVTVAEHVPAITNVTIANGPGTTQVRVADGGRLPAENAIVSIGKGGELKVESGGRVDYDGGGASFDKSHATISVADGGKLSVAGGTVDLVNFKGKLVASGSGTDTGIVSIASGTLRIASDDSINSVQAILGGRLEMTGGQLVVERTAPFSDTYLRITDGGLVEMSGDAQMLYKENGVAFGNGTFHLRDHASVCAKLTWDGGNNTPSSQERVRIAPTSGKTAMVTVDDDATIVIDGHQTFFYVNYGTDGSRAILNWNSSQKLDVVHTFAVGYVRGYAEVNLTRGQIRGGGYGFRVAQSGIQPVEGNVVTGVVNITGGSVLNSGSWTSADSVQGLIVGAGAVTSLTIPGFYRGTIRLSGGAVTNTSCYTGVGVGVAEGDVVQTGGEFRHQVATHEMIVGAWGGEGRYILSNGVASAMSDVFVGGATTNLLYEKPYALYKVCPVTNHCAKGLLLVAGGSFSTEKTLWVSQDGAGVLEIGPAGSVTAANVAFTNTPAALTGGTDLAAKVRFTCGPASVGTVSTPGVLTIGPGATLEVDSTALEDHGVFPLISFGTCEGDFASVSVTGRGAVVKTANGYVLDRTAGTVLIFR